MTDSQKYKIIEDLVVKLNDNNILETMDNIKDVVNGVYKVKRNKSNISVSGELTEKELIEYARKVYPNPKISSNVNSKYYALQVIFMHDIKRGYYKHNDILPDPDDVVKHFKKIKLNARLFDQKVYQRVDSWCYYSQDPLNYTVAWKWKGHKLVCVLKELDKELDDQFEDSIQRYDVSRYSNNEKINKESKNEAYNKFMTYAR